MDIKKIKIAYLTALQDGDTARAAELLTLLNDIENQVPDIHEPLPKFPDGQAVILRFWFEDEHTGLWCSNGKDEGLPRSDLDALITRDWRAAFDKTNPIRTLHHLITIHKNSENK